MKKLLVALAMVMLAAAISEAQEQKIGYVNLQRALGESAKGKKARDEFKGQVDKLQASLKRRKDELEGMKDQLEKKATVMKDEERLELEDDYRKKLRDFERSYKDSQADLQKKDTDLTGMILGELQEVIADYGKRNGYSLILEASASSVLYGDEKLDLTDDVIKLYNDRD
ncbi:MAG TPA: OmpH family outer membrane protein [Terriglobales bacterium]|nr:OmpH family outer membrane protein [Terriglobales bacterium]